MGSWAGKSLPYNVFGGHYSTAGEFGSGVRQRRTEGAAARARTLTASPLPARVWRADDSMRRRPEVRIPAIVNTVPIKVEQSERSDASAFRMSLP